MTRPESRPPRELSHDDPKKRMEAGHCDFRSASITDAKRTPGPPAGDGAAAERSGRPGRPSGYRVRSQGKCSVGWFA
jgi:hypothetical protein